MLHVIEHALPLTLQARPSRRRTEAKIVRIKRMSGRVKCMEAHRLALEMGEVCSQELSAVPLVFRQGVC